MKKLPLLSFLLLLMISLNSCAVVGGIFKAGAAVGIIAVVVVVGLIIWIISALRK